MKIGTAKKVGLFSAALMIIFTLSTIASVQAKQLSLKSQLKQSGISMKIVRLDRTDGFIFGLSFTGPQGRTFVLAPGLGGTFLAQVDGSDIIMQRDASGKMQLIQADGDLSLAICIAQAVLNFIESLTICQSEPVCMFKSVFDLVSNIWTCNTTVTPVE